jgi:thiol-disulfide isomerase/thioredoxin
VVANQPTNDAFFDPAKRAEAAAKALPAMQKMLPLWDELIAAVDLASDNDPEARVGLIRPRLELLGLMSLLGDADAIKELHTSSVSTSREEAVDAKAWLCAVDWVKTVKDPVAQEKVAIEFATLARTNIDNDMLAQTASLMAMKPASPVLGERIEDVVINTLRGPLAQRVTESMKRARRLRAVEGKPLVIEGATPDGNPFSTAGWKGKVVVVQFWTTSPPAGMADLPKLKKAYQEYHAKGLEIVGVTCDHDPVNFKAFLKDNPDMPWPQLLDANATSGPHPLLDTFGIETIPAAFIIDKKGVCRTVRGREKMEELIQRLLAE